MYHRGRGEFRSPFRTERYRTKTSLYERRVLSPSPARGRAMRFYEKNGGVPEKTRNFLGMPLIEYQACTPAVGTEERRKGVPIAGRFAVADSSRCHGRPAFRPRLSSYEARLYPPLVQR